MLDSKQIAALMLSISDSMQRHKEMLTELDMPIGDGDHGINMARGFQEVEAKLPALEGQDVGTLLKGVGMALVSKVGGASGPLYGTAFMKAGAICTGMTTVDGPMFLKMLDEAIGGVQMRGKAVQGEKTMLDALIPARDAFQAALASGADIKTAVGRAVQAAREGVEYTKTIIATKGRASYLGERSIGHQDPGATSTLLILEAVYAQLQ